MNFDSFTSDKHYLPEIGFDPFEHLYKLRVVLVQNDEYILSKYKYVELKKKNRNKENT